MPHNNDIDSVERPLWTCTLSATCRTMLRACPPVCLFASWASIDITAGEEPAVRGLPDLSYIPSYDDCCGVLGPAEALQYPMRVAAVAAFTRNHSHDFISVLLASADPWWKASNEIRALRTHQEPRWVAPAGRVSALRQLTSASTRVTSPICQFMSYSTC